jgi:hypothetical protein
MTTIRTDSRKRENGRTNLSEEQEIVQYAVLRLLLPQSELTRCIMRVLHKIDGTFAC